MESNEYINVIQKSLSKFDEMLIVVEGEAESYAIRFAKLCFVDVLQEFQEIAKKEGNDWK